MMTKCALQTALAAAAFAAAPAVAQVNFTLYQAGTSDFFTASPAGFTWGSLTDHVTDTASGLVINADTAAQGGGGVGRNASANLDAAVYEIQLTVEALPGNTAASVNVALNDSDAGGSEEYIYSLALPAVGAGPTTITAPASVYSELRPGGTPGDGIQNFGLAQWQIQSAGEAVLNVRVSRVELVQVGEVEEILLADYGAGYSLTFDGGSLALASFPDAYTFTDDAIRIVQPNTDFGNVGTNIALDLPAGQEWELLVSARALPENTAEFFNVVLVDNDGDDSDEGLGDEEWFYAVGFGGLNTETFTEVRIALDDTIFRQQGYNSFFDGDEVPNYGLRQLQIQTGNNTLAVEVDRIAFVRVQDEPSCPADFDGNETVNVNDLLGFLGAFRNQDASADFDGNSAINVNDLLGFLGAFRNGCPE